MTIKAALNSMLEEGYFDTPRDRNEITEFVNTFFDDKKKKVVSDISATLENLYLDGKIIKIEPDKSRGEKLIRFQWNPGYDPNG